MRCTPFFAALLVVSAATLVLADVPAVGSRATFFSTAPLPEGDLIADLQLDLSHLARSASTELFERPSFRTSMVANDCFSCRTLVGDHILASVLAKVDATCAATGCPIVKARCEWIAKNKEEFLGYIVVKLRPMHDGYLFCMGAGQCAHPSKATLSNEVDFSKNTSALFLSQLSSSVQFVWRGLQEMNVKQPGADDREGKEAIVLSEAEAASGWNGSPSENRFIDYSVDGSSEGKCHRCLAHSVRWVMKRSIRHIKHQCLTTKCPFFKAWCLWAHFNKHFVRGQIYAHVQPYKYAIGWCFGKEMCEHSKAATHVTSFPFTMKGSKSRREKKIGEVLTRPVEKERDPMPKYIN